MNCSKCNKEVSEEGKCLGCDLSQEECTCSVAETISEEESGESESSEETAEEAV